MTPMPRPTDRQRNQNIARALYVEKKPAAEIAKRFGVHPTTVYRAAETALKADRFAETAVPGGPLFSEMTSTGLRRFGGRIDDEYDRVFKSLTKRVAIYKEMANDPIVAAVLQAIKMTVRRVGWYVNTDGTTDADKQAAEFVEQSMHDMSQGWNDSIDQALNMMQFGFQLAELVYKRRNGPKADAGSKYDDGRIGWRKWAFIAPDSLAPGQEWIMDDNGGTQGFRQQDVYRPGGAIPVDVPITKAILFRTVNLYGNPEGRAVLRGMYQSYHFKKGLEEIEAISAERLGAGFPVIYAGQDVGKGAESGSDLEALKDIVRNIRVDEQMGLVFPWAKMGSGAPEGKGVLFELVSPPGRGAVDFNQTITRHSQNIAMTGLAQFIHLGMSGVGARSLGESSQDFFTLAVGAWADSIADTINRYAVDRLMGLNLFPGLTCNPKIAHESISGTNLSQMAAYINQLAGAQLITPTPELEKHLRELADLPITDVDAAFAEKAKKSEAPALVSPPVTTSAPEESEDETEVEPVAQETETTNAVVGELRAAIAALEHSERMEAERARAEQFSATLAALGTGRGAAVEIGTATLQLPEGFQFEQPNITVNATVDTAPIATAMREAIANQPAPQVTVNIPPQPAPIVNIPPAQVTVNVPETVVNVKLPDAPAALPPVITNQIITPDTEETIDVLRDDKGYINKLKKTRKARGKVN